MYREHVLDAFNLEDQNAFNNEIDPIAAIQVDALVFHWKRYLSLETDPAKMQFMAEALFVCRLKESRTKCSMHLNCGANHALGQFFVK